MTKRKPGARKGQNTAEYAILIALVVGAVVAMQTFTQRNLQARMRGASLTMKDDMNQALTDAGVVGFDLGRTAQYEPYYQNSQYTTTTDKNDLTIASADQVGVNLATNRERAAGGYDTTGYNAEVGASGQD
ncbi:MAG: hypothetical protein GX606_05155 [Elusimicrobia bacterium]|nr:hypothetical protein [Elusimicrobiota bacterium]